MTAVRCEYCGHTAHGALSACTNCGGPLPVAEVPASLLGMGDAGDVRAGPRAHLDGRMLDQVAHRVGLPEHGHGGRRGTDVDDEHQHSPGTGRRGPVGALRARLIDPTEAGLRRRYPRWQWQLTGGLLVAALLVLVILVIRSCSFAPGPLTAAPGFDGAAGPTASLPDALRNASCRAQQDNAGGRSCVLAADSPLLRGGITGGRPLTFHVRTARPAPLARTIDQWRQASTTVLSDGAVFAALSASAALWYADTESGLRLDTGAFDSAAGARTFLSRSGLPHSW